MKKKGLLVFIFFLTVSFDAFSGDRYWIAGALGVWSNVANWSTTSGGGGGSAAPIAGDDVYFDGNGAGTCNVDAVAVMGSLNLTNTYIGIIDLNGFSFTVSGGTACSFYAGTINDTPGTSSVDVVSTGQVMMDGTTFGADVNISGGRVRMNGGTFNGTSSFTKTAASDDDGTGGMIFLGDFTFTNAGSARVMLGNTTLDTYGGNVTINNTGTDHFYLARGAAGSTIAGDLTINSYPTGGNGDVYVADQTASSLAVTGSVVINITGANTGQDVYFGHNGDVTVGGTFTGTNSGTGTNSRLYIANNENSLVTITGPTTLTNGNTAGTSQRIYVGNQGDVICNGTLDIVNNSGKANSEVYLNHNSNSANLYNDNVTFTSNHSSCDGVFFGNAGGACTLADTKTILIPGGGAANFIGGQLYFRNFTQTGAATQAFELGPSCTYIYNYDNNWGGNVSFKSPRIYTRGTTYLGTATIEKTGASDDNSIGGNTFTGDATIINSGSAHLMFANGTADTFGANVTLTNSGTDHLYFAQNAAGNSIAGDLTVINSASGGANYVYVGNNAATTVPIGGNVLISQNGTGSNQRVYLGDDGEVSIGGTLTAFNTGSGAASRFYFANASTAILNVTGPVSITNSHAATTTSECYIGNSGSINFSSTTAINNLSGASGNSLMDFCYEATSTGVFGGDITVTCTHVLGDGIRFGASGGSSTLAATKTISIPGVDATNFASGQLYFRNFTQIGATAQALEIGASGSYIYNYDSNWGGDVDFKAPRMYTRGTTYSGTARLEKNGGSGDDQSVGGNTFTGNTTLINSGSREFLMGNGTADTFGGDVTMTNSGTDHMYLAYNSAGNTVAGNLSVLNSATGANNYINIADLAASDISVAGNVTIDQTGSATNNYVYFGDNGGAAVTGSVTVTNSGTGTNSNVYIGNVSTSLVTIGTSLTATNNGSANCNLYVGSSGDVTIGTLCNITNSGTGGNSDCWIANGSSSQVSIGTSLSITNNGSANSDVYLGDAGDVTIGTTFTALNSGTGADSYIYVADNATSTVTIGGVSDLTNGNTAGTNQRLYLGNAGGVTFDDDLTVANNASAANSLVYMNYSTGSVNAYNGNIIISSTDANCDGYYIGQNGGSGTLAATKTISIPGVDINNFIGGQIYLENFTQIGSTAQALELGAACTYIYNYDNAWGGDVVFKAPRINARGTTFSGTSHLEKTGASDDACIGGNTFTGNSTLVNSGLDYFVFGNGTADIFGADLSLTNSGDDHLYIAHNSAGNTIAGNLTSLNSATGTSGHVFISTGAASTLSIGGNATLTQTGSTTTNNTYFGDDGDVTVTGSLTTINSSTGTNCSVIIADGTTSLVTIGTSLSSTNNGSATTNYTYVGNSGDVTVGTTLDATNAGSATTSNLYVGNGTNSTVTIGGATTITNSNTATTTQRIYLGNAGGVTFDDDLTVANNASATNSLVYMNYSTGSVNAYNGNIIISSTDANCDGYYIGQNGGSGTLAATKTISIPGVDISNFIGGQIYMRNFTQIGATAQALELGAGSTYIYNYDNSWGGDIVFKAPRMNTRGSTYSLTSYLEKTGASDDDCIGNNTFTGNSTLVNSGTDRFMFANGNPDVFGGNLIATNSGTDHMYIAYNAAGNTIAGDYTATNSSTGTAGYLSTSSAAASTLTIGGNVILNQTGSANTNTMHLGDAGDVSVTGSLTSANSGTGTTSHIYVGDDEGSTIGIGTSITATNNGISTTRYTYIGNNGDVNIGTFLDLDNSGSGTAARVYVGAGTNSAVVVGSSVTAVNNGTSTTRYTYIGDNGDVNIGTFLDLTNSGSGTTANMYVADGTNSLVTVGTSMSAVTAGSATTQYDYFGNTGDLTIGTTLDITNSGTGTTSRSYVGNAGASTVIIGDATTVTTTNTAATNQGAYLGNSGDVTFGGDLTMANGSGATNSLFYLSNSAGADNTYNGNIILSSTHANCDGYYIGQGNGSGTLAGTKTISIPGVDISNFIGGQIYLENFTQLGATDQSLDLATTASYVYNYNNSWGGNVDFKAPRIYTRTCTFSGNASFTKKGIDNDDSYGENTFAGATSFDQQGTGRWRIGNNVLNDYNGNLTCLKSNTGALDVAYGTASTVFGNVNINASSEVRFGGGNGSLTMDGTAAQSINDLATSTTPNFRRLLVNNPNDEITLNMDIDVETLLTLTQGNIISSAASLLNIRDAGGASSGSASSYVDGVMKKTGNDDNFVFPVGKAGYWARLAMNDVSSYGNDTEFTCEYFPAAPVNTTSKVATLWNVSTLEYWDLDRVFDAGDNASCNVTLYWEDETRSDIEDPSDMKVAHYDGSVWQDQGGLGTGVDLENGGYVTSSVKLTSFSPVTLAGASAGNNPLPVELTTFDAEKQDDITVNIIFETASEINNDYFTVERSINGMDFYEIAVIRGNGNSTDINSYEFLDENPVLGAVNYYRLIQTDFDGSTEVSRSISVDFTDQSVVADVYPNPISSGEIVYVKVDNLAGTSREVLLIVHNSVGKQVYSKETIQEEGSMIGVIESGNLAPGVYLIIVSSDHTLFQRRLLVR